MPVRGRPLSVWLLGVLLGQLSVRGFVGGAALVVDPSGRIVGAPTAPLDTIPVSDFLVPGLVLILAFGLLPAGVCYGLYAGRRWARLAAIAVSLALLLWIVVEVVLGFSRPTVFLNLGTAIGIGGVAMYPAVRRDLRDARE